MRRRFDGRVLGPYNERGRWRVVVITAEGVRSSRYCATAAEANRVARGAEEAFGALTEARTVGAALDDYEVYMRSKGNKPGSIASTMHRLRGFFGPLSDRRLRRLSDEECEDRYRELTADGREDRSGKRRPWAVDTHRNALAQVKTFARWCVAKGWIKRSPVDEIEGMGRRQRGKEQLRIDEARRWAAAARRFAEQGSDGAVAALMALTMGMRSSEIVSRQVRDLDDAGTVIWIPDAKTPAGRRRLRVSGMVSDLLAARAEGRKPTDRLLSVTRRETVRKWVRRICAAAGVPMVTTHGLRGLCGSLNTEVVADVARMLGHSSSRVTLMHYVDPSALQSGRTMTMDHLLAEKLRKSVDGGPADTDPPSGKGSN